VELAERSKRRREYHDSGALGSTNLVVPGSNPHHVLGHQLESVVGAQSVSCDAVWLEPTAQEGSASSSGSSTQLHCRLPRDIETVAGLPAALYLASKTINAAIVVPNVDIGYDGADGEYFVDLLVNGRRERTPIEVGVSDGVVRVVTSDLPIGAVVMSPNDSP
jgi:hypothetical protein